MKKTILLCLVSLIIGLSVGGLATYIINYESGQISYSGKISYKDVPEDEICYRGSGVWSTLSPKIRYDDFFQGIERIAVNYKHGVTSDGKAKVFECFTRQNEAECRAQIARDNPKSSEQSLNSFYESYKRSYERIPEYLRPDPIFEKVKYAFGATIGKCGTKEKEITLHFDSDTPIFNQKGTLSVFVETKLSKDKILYLTIMTYRSGLDFSYIKDMQARYFKIKTLGRSDKEILEEIKRSIFKAYFG
jgi:hypothetical protein